VFAKDFMNRHGIPTADYKTFNNFQEAKKYVQDIRHPIVIKASGLAGGKGVLMPTTTVGAVAGLYDMMEKKIFGQSGSEVVIEEQLIGDEISLAICSDGVTFKTFPPGQDHQRIYNGNVEPNTGGMGCYAPTSLCNDLQMREIHDRILKPTIDGMMDEGKQHSEGRIERFVFDDSDKANWIGNSFIGMICIGVIMTKDGPKNLEYNVRFGDPEAQILFPLLTSDSDLVLIMNACIEQRLPDVKFEFRKKCAVNVVLASGGYPGAYSVGYEIDIEPLEEGMFPRILLFYCSEKS